VLTAVPALVVYGIWYVGWFAQLHRVAGTGENLPLVPLELVYGLGAAIVAVLGLPPMRFAWVGAGIGIAVLIGLAWIGRRRGLRPTPLAVAAVFALVVEYVLQAVFRGSFGIDHGARSAYLYPAAIFIWLAIAATIGHRLDPRGWTGGRRLWVPALIGLLVVPMALGNMLQFWLAARAMEPLRATEVRELALMVRLRDTLGLALDTAPDTDLMPQVTARDYFAAIDRFGEPQVAYARLGDSLPGPDTTMLNAFALRLLGAAVTVGPDGEPGPTAPVLGAMSGAAASDIRPGCTTLTTAQAQASATWSPPTPGVTITTDGKAVVDVSLGLYAPADAPADPMVLAAINSGDTFWLPQLPASLAWTMTVRVQGDGTLHICSRVKPN
jgi:hypothetical protein